MHHLIFYYVWHINIFRLGRLKNFLSIFANCGYRSFLKKFESTDSYALIGVKKLTPHQCFVRDTATDIGYHFVSSCVQMGLLVDILISDALLWVVKFSYIYACCFRVLLQKLCDYLFQQLFVILMLCNHLSELLFFMLFLLPLLFSLFHFHFFCIITL